MSATITARQQAEAQRWITEPIYWARKFGGASFDPWSGQEQFWVEYGKVLNAKIKKWKGVPMTEEERRYARKIGISIMAGQGVGKGATISLAGLHYLFALQSVRPKAVCTAPAGPQLQSSLWPEFGAWLQRNPMLGEIFEKIANRIFLKEDADRGTVSRIEPRTVQPNANPEEQKVVLAGVHATGVLYLIDEASGVPEAVFEPVEGGLTDPLSMVIVIFNPTKRNGFAAETHRKNREMWVCLHWDGEDLRKEKLEHPGRFAWFNEDIQLELKRKYGEDSDFYRVRVRGLPPNQSSNTLISYESVMDALERRQIVLPGDPLVIPVDVAGAGAQADESIVGTLRGNTLTKLKAFKFHDTTALGDAVAGHLKNELMGLEPGQQYAVGVDVIGMGRGVYDHLVNVQQIRRCFGIDVSEKALDPLRFPRLRDQVGWELREAFMEEKSICLNLTDERGQPYVDDELVGQLTSIQWGEVNGKIKVQGKGESSGIPGVKPLAVSPDRFDTLAMGHWLLKHYCSTMPLAARLQRRRRAVQGDSWKVV
jgi:phage terminase large subunit